MDAAKKSYDIPKFKEQYNNFIGGEFSRIISDAGTRYRNFHFENISNGFTRFL